jgi:hypothetical protein
LSAAATLSCFGVFAGGLFAAYVDFHATEVQATMLVVLATAFAFGAIYPRGAWLWAMLVPFCLAASHWIAPRFGILPRDAGHLGNPFYLMILAVPAAASSYLGAGLRWILRGSQRGQL